MFRWQNTALDVPRTHLPDRDLHRAEPLGVRAPGACGCAGDPLGDPTVALRGSHHCQIGSTTGNHVEHRVVPYQAVPARPHLMTPPASQACGYPESMRGVWHHQARRRQGPRAHRHRGHSREGPSHGRLEWTWSREGLAPCTRTGAERGKDLRAGCANRDARSPSRDSKNTIALACSKDATSMRGTCHIVTLAGEATGEGRRRAGQDTTGSRF